MKEPPHYDTINDFPSRIDPKEPEKVGTYMIKQLLAKRCFDCYRINGKYLGIIIDGTGLFMTKKLKILMYPERGYLVKETGCDSIEVPSIVTRSRIQKF